MTAALAACKPGAEILRFSGQTMGTTYNVAAIDPTRSVDAKALEQAIGAALAEVNTQMSNWDSGSEISRVNAAGVGEQVQLSPALARVMQGADAVHKASEGMFDVTVGPLIDLWGFGSGLAAPHMPEASAIAETMTRTGQENVLSLQGDRLSKTAPGAEIYLSAIGKGYGVDRVAEAVKGFGLSDFMVEIGGDLYTSGYNGDGSAWQIGIESPVSNDRGLFQVVGVSGLGMATSGDYRNFFESDGTRYSHIIDPTTGRPITHATVSATVLTEDAMLADAWATAMLTLGRERGLAIAEEQNLAVLFIDRDASGFATTASSRFSTLKA
ncbi:MAG: thiamine biosynthesis protein ApbE [Rhodobacteraceae bacterium]|nr:thiamine biosynthesis protein ApbE [Paracoccaceae bacterium]